MNNTDNIKKCPHFDSCSQALCPLDLDLASRFGKTQDKCRWMREAKTTKIKGRVFVTGGSTMPNAILYNVPQCNLGWLNTATRRLWLEINKQIGKNLPITTWNKQLTK